MKIHLVGAEIFHVDRYKDRWTDMAMLIIDCRNFKNAPDFVLNNTLVVVSPNDSFGIKAEACRESDSYVG
jgi:hypothetical protein